MSQFQENLTTNSKSLFFPFFGRFWDRYDQGPRREPSGYKCRIIPPKNAVNDMIVMYYNIRHWLCWNETRNINTDKCQEKYPIFHYTLRLIWANVTTWYILQHDLAEFTVPIAWLTTWPISKNNVSNRNHLLYSPQYGWVYGPQGVSWTLTDLSWYFSSVFMFSCTLRSRSRRYDCQCALIMWEGCCGILLQNLLCH